MHHAYTMREAFPLEQFANFPVAVPHSCRYQLLHSQTNLGVGYIFAGPIRIRRLVFCLRSQSVYQPHYCDNLPFSKGGSITKKHSVPVMKYSSKLTCLYVVKLRVQYDVFIDGNFPCFLT